MHEGRFVRLQWAPIAVDTAAFEALARDPEVQRHARSIRERLGPDRTVLLGVDRLDYTKGIDVRLKALQTFFERHTREALDCAFLQIAVPSREEVPEYMAMREHVEQLVGQLNGTHGRPGYAPVTYMYRKFPVDELTAAYRAADVMLVTPLCDGMNLVAKEYAATRIDDTGLLVLSEFAGAAAELQSALLVNPFDVNGLARTLRDAVRMDPEEQRVRMSALRARVREHDVYGWSRECLSAIEA